MLDRCMRRDGFGGFGGTPAGGYAPSPQGFGPGGGFPPPGGPMTPGTEGDVNTTLPFVLSIVSTVVCCDPVLGLPAIVFAIQARNARNRGALDVARKRALVSLVLGGAGIGLGLALELFELFRYLTARGGLRVRWTSAGDRDAFRLAAASGRRSSSSIYVRPPLPRR